MRFLLLIKWLFITIFVALAWLPAMPLFLVFMWSNRYDTQSYLKHMGGELRYDIEEDFLKARLHDADDVGILWIVGSLLLLAVVIYWRTHG